MFRVKGNTLKLSLGSTVFRLLFFSKTGLFFAVRLMLKSFSVSYSSNQGQESISSEREKKREKGASSRHCDNCLAVESMSVQMLL